jgi:predicted nucleotidyltransferase
MIHPFVENKMDAIRTLMQLHKVRKGYLFGSSVAGRFGDNSDIDILIEIDESIDPVELGGHLWDLQFDLQKLLGRKVDILTSRSLKNPYLKESIDQSKQLIYG